MTQSGHQDHSNRNSKPVDLLNNKNEEHHFFPTAQKFPPVEIFQ